MISQDLKSVRAFIDIISATRAMTPAECKLVLNKLASTHEKAMALEATVIPRRQRIIPADLAGNVKLFPIVARPEQGIR